MSQCSSSLFSSSLSISLWKDYSATLAETEYAFIVNKTNKQIDSFEKSSRRSVTYKGRHTNMHTHTKHFSLFCWCHSLHFFFTVTVIAQKTILLASFNQWVAQFLSIEFIQKLNYLGKHQKFLALLKLCALNFLDHNELFCVEIQKTRFARCQQQISQRNFHWWWTEIRSWIDFNGWKSDWYAYIGDGDVFRIHSWVFDWI